MGIQYTASTLPNLLSNKMGCSLFVCTSIDGLGGSMGVTEVHQGVLTTTSLVQPPGAEKNNGTLYENEHKFGMLLKAGSFPVLPAAMM